MSERVDLKTAAEFFRTHDNFLILSHANPDGDTLGCAFGLCGGLQLIGKKAKNICADAITSHYDFMKRSVETQDFEPQVIVTVDVADKKLLGDFEPIYGDRIDFAIDHHGSHVEFAKRLLLEPDNAACAQTIYKLLVEMDVPINSGVASCLYTGIATDSGCFKYSSVTPETHMIAAELIKFDFDFSRINYVFFDQKSKERIAIEQKIFSEIEYFCGGRCAVVILTADDLSRICDEDVNGISAVPRQIEGVEVSVVFKEKKKGWKASLRSNSDVNVQEICGMFGGGGHVKAAGCSFGHMDINDAKKQIVAEIEKALK